MLAWAHSMRINTSLEESQNDLEEAMLSRVHEDRATLTDPKEAYHVAMAIVRRQNKLKNPRLVSKELWHLRDTLNLLAEKLGLPGWNL